MASTTTHSLATTGRSAILVLGLLFFPTVPKIAFGQTEREAPRREARPDQNKPEADREPGSTRRIRGQLNSVDGSNLVLIVGDGGRKAVVPTVPRTEFGLDGRKAVLADLKPGYAITVVRVEGFAARVEARQPRRARLAGPREARRDGEAKEADRRAEERGEARPREAPDAPPRQNVRDGEASPTREGDLRPRIRDEARPLEVGGEEEQRDEVTEALKKAASYYRDRVASHGGYAYYYSTDLKQRWGEGKASVDTIFVQPPGTPTVGMAYLKVYTATHDRFYLEAACEAAEALVYGQLASGGWTQVIHFAPPERGRMGKYRKGKGGSWNASSLDDGQTQAALQFLVQADQTLNFQDAEIHEAAIFGLNALLKAQFPNGGFPQVWTGPVEPEPVRTAHFPDYDWKTEGRVKNYWDYYTLNDNLAGTVADTLIVAHEVYRDEKYRDALRNLGDFLILAQMPEPQPGWCQQYNYDMVPIWARKFEPPAITGWESQDAMETLIKIARHTGEMKYLEPIPAALDYFTSKCLLPDGRIARYYELRTNKPLYMDKNYQLTYDDSAAPSHYGWKQAARFDQIAKAYQAVKSGQDTTRTHSSRELEKDVRRILTELDDKGRWITTYAGESLVGQPKFERGFRYISSGVFSRNFETLAEYLAASRK